ncbi:protease inhibitor I42 family protein [Pseudomonas sp. RP23018S]|uniref:protease inhibitor I42 family protein n=1 Tax=Pseudomonas sp. RP23018S TaxID=3096037 RepID=UPI002ACAFD6E|nr:protease inhibitor I42 family protein [Pseudomonas sp. RP23018S]MDZ5603542.1 protease inhibitor I42 family protein [Pseudomonas sp. RP23018S]
MSVCRLLFPLGMALLSACTFSPHDNALIVSDADDCPLHLSVGQTLTLQLSSNPTTGYRWRLAQPGAEVLRLLGPQVYTAPEDIGLVGSAGVTQWRFQAQHPGKRQLTLVYQQPWAPEVKPVETFSCTINVR